MIESFEMWITFLQGVGGGRSYLYLKENSKAAIIVAEPEEIKPNSKAIRVYLEVTSFDTEGDFFNEVKEGVAMRAGKQAADGLQAAGRR